LNHFLLLGENEIMMPRIPEIQNDNAKQIQVFSHSFLLPAFHEQHSFFSIQTIDFIPDWDSVRVLKNPYKGWYHHLLDNGIKVRH
jgi:hypothetical protein